VLSLSPVVISAAIALFPGMLILVELGRRLGQRRLKRDPEGPRVGTGAIEAAVLGLLGLLLAFQFSGAAARFDARRQIIVSQANAIGTAWLRLDLLPAEDQPALRDLFRQYVDALLALVARLPDIAAFDAEVSRVNALLSQIWTQAVVACRDQPPSTVTLLLAALNEMIDLTTTRAIAVRTHAPLVVSGLLFCVALVSAVLAGYAAAPARQRPLMHMLLFAAITAIAVFVILDLEFPRVGFIRVDVADQALTALRASM